MLKLSENPRMLYPAVGSIRELTGRWWVAHTKSRNEKAFAWDLVSRAIPYFLPMIERTSFSGGRRRRVLAPLFPSYVFVSCQPEERHRVLATDRICQLIPVADQLTLISELSLLERAMVGDAKLEPYAFAAVGKRCRVARGTFKGLEGIVINRQNSTELVLQVSLLGRGAIMQIEMDLLEAVD